MPYVLLPLVLGSLFLLVLGYVAWLKFYEHLQAHRHDHEQRSHHLVAVRKIRKRKRKAGGGPHVVVESQPVRS